MIDSRRIPPPPLLRLSWASRLSWSSRLSWTLRLSWALSLLVAATALVAALSVAAPAAAQEAALESQRAVEQRLLVRDLLAFSAARQDAEAAESVYAEVASRHDEALAAAVSPAELNGLEELATELSVTAEVVEGARRRLAELRGRVMERRRRLAVLDQLLGPGAGEDPLTGRWQVELDAGAAGAFEVARTGRFDLFLAGSRVSGRYRFDDGAAGSLSGSLVGDRLRLEGVDTTTGLDGIFNGTLDRAAGAISGFWTPSQVSGGAPGGSSFRAVRGSLADDAGEAAGDEDGAGAEGAGTDG